MCPNIMARKGGIGYRWELRFRSGGRLGHSGLEEQSNVLVALALTEGFLFGAFHDQGLMCFDPTDKAMGRPSVEVR